MAALGVKNETTSFLFSRLIRAEKKEEEKRDSKYRTALSLFSLTNVVNVKYVEIATHMPQTRFARYNRK